MRSWKLPTPTRAVDKLKSALLGEMASAEWELLEEKEWDDEVQEPAQPSAAGQDRERELGSDKNGSDYTTIISASSSGNGETQPDTSNEQAAAGRLKGKSGWTKLRNR